MKNYKKIICLFMSIAMLFSLTGCVVEQIIDIFPYMTKQEMIDDAISFQNGSRLSELLVNCTPEERAKYVVEVIDRSVEIYRFNIADQICELGVDINDSDYPMITILAQQLDYEGVEYLLKKGADPNLRDSDGCSPLFYSLMNASGQWEASGYYLSKLLVEYGAEPYPEMFHNEYEGDPERNVGNGAYRQIVHSPLTAQYLLGILLDIGKESGLPKAVEYAILGECERSLNELKNGNTVSDVDMGLISYYFGYFGTMEQYQAFADFWGKYAKPPASCVAGAGNAEVLKRLYLDKDPDNENSKEYVLDFQSCDMLISAMQLNQTEVVKLLLSYESINHEWKDDVWFRAFNGGFEGLRLLYDFWEENVEGGFKEELIEQFYPDRGRASIDKYKKIDFLFEKGFDCRYITFNHCTADTIKYLYEKGRPMMPDDLKMTCSWGGDDEVKAVIDNGKINIEYAYSFDIRGASQIELRYDEDAIRYQYTGYSDVGEGFMTYDELCNSTEKNNGLEWFCLYQKPETVQYAIDHGLELPDDCLLSKWSYQYSAANVKVLLENGANTKIKTTQLPKRGGGWISTGKEYTLKEYFKACDRDDLVELLKEYD